jgi:hypothetical protein
MRFSNQLTDVCETWLNAVTAEISSIRKLSLDPTDYLECDIVSADSQVVPDTMMDLILTLSTHLVINNRHTSAPVYCCLNMSILRTGYYSYRHTEPLLSFLEVTGFHSF